MQRPSGKRLLRLRNINTSAVAWAPGGRRLAFISSLRPEEKPNKRVSTGVRIVDLAGRTRLLNRMDSAAVSWARTGRVAWDTNLEYPTSGAVWTGKPDGTEMQRVARRAGQPRWSFSGRRLAFACRGGLCASRPDGSSRRLLTRACELEPSGELDPAGYAWAPDGTAIACGDKRGNLIVVDLRTQHVDRIRSASAFPLAAELGAIDWQPRRGHATN